VREQVEVAARAQPLGGGEGLVLAAEAQQQANQVDVGLVAVLDVAGAKALLAQAGAHGLDAGDRAPVGVGGFGFAVERLEGAPGAVGEPPGDVGLAQPLEPALSLEKRVERGAGVAQAERSRAERVERLGLGQPRALAARDRQRLIGLRARRLEAFRGGEEEGEANVALGFEPGVAGLAGRGEGIAEEGERGLRRPRRASSSPSAIRPVSTPRA